MIAADGIRDLRKDLGLTQAQLGQLLGVHSLTVSKWERGLLTPTPYYFAMLDSFKTARKRKPEIGNTVATLLVGAGIAAALYFLLKAAIED